MNDFDNVSELVNKTGCTYEEARYAYEACNKDMLQAIIMLEKSKDAKNNNKNEKAYKAADDMKQQFRKGVKQTAEYTRDGAYKLSRNNLIISDSKGLEQFTIPLIAALIVGIIFFQIALPAIVISLFCGVSYTITGPDISKDIVIRFNNDSKTAQKEKPDVQPAQYTYTETVSDDKGFFN